MRTRRWARPTLNGLMREHGIDPVTYMTFAHDIYLAALAPDEASRKGGAAPTSRSES
jgi:hypothetical protein